jgi:hypothetical protein
MVNGNGKRRKRGGLCQNEAQTLRTLKVVGAANVEGQSKDTREGRLLPT